MCGISGFIGVQRSAAADTLVEMQAALRRRGPDDHGCWSNGAATLMHTRLSIIDLNGSRQPMTNDDATVVLSYNGEIYNYRDLRRDLQRRGHQFKTRGDSEVILRLYEQFGSNAPARLDGMFAFAIYDAREHTLLLARDAIGVKP